MWETFWNAYAGLYDTITGLVPYQDLLRDLDEALRPAPEERVLDAGCGTGQLLRRLEGRARLHGVDASPVMLRRAARRCPAATLRQADLDGRLPFEDGSFDAVVSSNVLYALPRPAHSLAEFHRVVRPGGRLVLATPRARPSILGLVAAQLHPRNGPAAWLRFLGLLPALLLVWLFNGVLLVAGERREMHFLAEDELRGLVEGAGFAGLEIRPAYAGQDWLVRAVRPGPEGP